VKAKMLYLPLNREADGSYKHSSLSDLCRWKLQAFITFWSL